MFKFIRVLFGDCAFVARQRRDQQPPRNSSDTSTAFKIIDNKHMTYNKQKSRKSIENRPMVLYEDMPYQLSNGGVKNSIRRRRRQSKRERKREEYAKRNNYRINDSPESQMNQVFREFADETSMHGVPKIINSRSLTAKIFWSLICLVAFGMFIWQTGILLARFYSYPKKVNVEIVQRPVRFPHVTICNMKPLDMIAVNVIENIRENASKNIELLKKFPDLRNFTDKYTSYRQQVISFMGASVSVLYNSNFMDSMVEFHEFENNGGGNGTDSFYYNETFPNSNDISETAGGYTNYNSNNDDDDTNNINNVNNDDNNNSDINNNLPKLNILERKMMNYLKTVNSKLGLAANIGPQAISKAGIKSKEFIVHCIFMGEDCTDDKGSITMFTQVFNEIFFNCFTFASENLMNNTATRLHGVEQGLSLLLFTGSASSVEERDEFITPGVTETDSPLSGSTGARVVIHAPNTKPHPEAEGFDASPGLTVRLGIKARENVRISEPWGNCTRDYMNSSALKYTLLSCQNNCIQKHIIEKCNCMDNRLPNIRKDVSFCYKLPDEWTLAVKGCRNSGADLFDKSSKRNCRNSLIEWYQNLECASEVYSKMTIHHPNAIDSCKCYPPCEDILYDVSYSISKFPPRSSDNKMFFDKIDNFLKTTLPIDKNRIVRRKLEDQYKINSTKNKNGFIANETAMLTDEFIELVADKYFTRVTVYIADSNVIKTEESPDYEAIRLVSDIGGQLGLWIGISVMTIFEVLQLCLDVFAYATKRGRNMGQKKFNVAGQLMADDEEDNNGRNVKEKRGEFLRGSSSSSNRRYFEEIDKLTTV